jgi:sugar-specific transcriptional regulator TrmB
MAGRGSRGRQDRGGQEMDAVSKLTEFGFSQYETGCYLALVASHPSNGSQLSRMSGIARSRIYDVLRSLTRKGLVFEVSPGIYVPLPFVELKKRLRSQFELNLSVLEEELTRETVDNTYEFIFTIRGVEQVLAKALEMIDAARQEVYIRLFPETAKRLEASLVRAMGRGVGVRFVAMGEVTLTCPIQITHPFSETLLEKIGGESIDIITDKAEALGGIFETGRENASPIMWTRNRWFIIGNRDSLRHDFYHYFLNKTYDGRMDLTESEKRIYAFIKADD